MNRKSPPLAGFSLVVSRNFPKSRTGWLTWEDSNFHIPISKNAFEMSGDFRCFGRRLDLETFAAESCGSEQTRRRSKHQNECLTSTPQDVSA